MLNNAQGTAVVGHKSISINQLDELHEIQCCLSAIADLMIPCNDLHIVNRENLSVLMNYFSNKLQKATEHTESATY